jgi:CrcB protein
MQRLLLVGIGGFIGSVFRYLLSGFVQNLSISFPLGTLVVNSLGCFIIGLLSYLAEEHGVFTTETRLLIFVGFLGGFTTFSTFSNETMNLFRSGENFWAILNVCAHVILGITLVWIGRVTAYLIWK